MRTVRELIEEQMRNSPLDILLFGPAISPANPDPYISSLQAKRAQIRDVLTDEGHIVQYGEDVYDPTLPPYLKSPLVQEIAAMRDADMVIVLVASPGSIAESTAMSMKKEILPRSSFYCFTEHKGGLVANHLESVPMYGGHMEYMSLSSVQACNLTASVLDRVRKIHVAKTFLF